MCDVTESNYKFAALERSLFILYISRICDLFANNSVDFYDFLILSLVFSLKYSLAFLIKSTIPE